MQPEPQIPPYPPEQEPDGVPSRGPGQEPELPPIHTPDEQPGGPSEYPDPGTDDPNEIPVDFPVEPGMPPLIDMM
jgi:hypothetical protein